MRILNNTLKSPGKEPGSQMAWQTDTAGQRPQFIGCYLGTCISKKLPDDVYVLVRGACSQKPCSDTTTQILVFIGPRA